MVVSTRTAWILCSLTLLACPSDDGSAPPADAGADASAAASSSDAGDVGDASTVSSPRDAGSPSASPYVLPAGISTFASDQSPFGSVLVDDAFVYWGNVDAVMKAPLRGGAAVVLAQGDLSPRQLALGAGFVYFSNANGDSVMRVSTEGGTPEVLASGLGSPSGIAVDDRYVYFGTGYTRGSSAGATIQKVPLAGGAPVVLAAGRLGPRGLAVDASSVYWVYDGSGVVNAGAVYKVPLTGGEPVALAQGFTADNGAIAIDGRFAYFGDFDGNVRRAALTGVGASVLVPAGGRHTSGTDAIALDATHVYWTSSLSGVLMRATLTGGDATELPREPDARPAGLALSASGVFWGDLANTTIDGQPK